MRIETQRDFGYRMWVGWNLDNVLSLGYRHEIGDHIINLGPFYINWRRHRAADSEPATLIER